MSKTTLETYGAQKTRHSNEISGFSGLFWAFSNSQLEEGMAKLNCTAKDLIGIGAGGLILKSQLQEFKDTLARHSVERKELKKDTKKLFDALVYELNNHEYCITYDVQDALDTLELTKEDIEPALLKKACRESIKQTC